MKTCTTCRYARLFDADRMCARFPRTVVRENGNNISMMPRVLDDDWCGEHRRDSLWHRFVQRFFR